MEGLAIATFPVGAAAISGESLLFRTVLENRGDVAVDVPSRQSPCQFRYELRQQREGGRIYVLSALDREQRRSSYVAARAPVQYEALFPGQRIEFTEDLADYLNNNFSGVNVSESADNPFQFLIRKPERNSPTSRRNAKSFTARWSRRTTSTRLSPSKAWARNREPWK